MDDKESAMMGSTICSGSHMHRRVFNPEDPWLSVESTILAGNVTLSEESSPEQQNELSTVPEEKERNSMYPSIELEPIVDDNVLNMNIDAISDDDVFFDCTTSPCLTPKKSSPCPSPRKFSPCLLPRKFSPRTSPNNFYDSLSSPKSPAPKTKRSPTPRFGQFLLVDDCATATSSGATDASSSVDSGQRTGGLIVQIVDDFNDMKDHAQSTPKLEESDSGYFQLPVNSGEKSAEKKSGEKSKCGERSKSPKPPVPPKKSPGPRKSPAGKPKSPTYKTMSPVDPKNKENYYRGKYSRAVTDRMPLRPRRVVLIKQFFESRILSESQSIQKLPAKSSSSIHYKTTLRKSPRLNDLRSLSPEAAEASSSKKRSARSRPSSCSEISSTESSASRASNNRSKSTSDATTDNSAERIKTQRLNNVAIRRYKLINQRTTLHANSPKDSTIKKRRSFGLVSSPIKPVREIRKIFSPRYQANKTENTKNKPKLLKTPRIIYTNEK